MDVNGRSSFVGAVCILYIQVSEARLECGLRVIVEAVGENEDSLDGDALFRIYLSLFIRVKKLLG
jgi:hypothetical protein